MITYCTNPSTNPFEGSGHKMQSAARILMNKDSGQILTVLFGGMEREIGPSSLILSLGVIHNTVVAIHRLALYMTNNSMDLENICPIIKISYPKGSMMAVIVKEYANNILPQYPLPAMQYYTYALNMAPPADPNRCVFLANRCESFLRLNRPQDAMWDAQAALAIIAQNKVEAENLKKAGGAVPVADSYEDHLTRINYPLLEEKLQARMDKAMQMLIMRK
eukprot:TRINITY_DN18696_c0_g1_i1.p1 TRINITY_DN18696_c0_g1~~TRINITY_DN18696_c0_g1_i1.p1  ORF type:complete len:220 (-),score=17.00 TRINITY_DN18696_c0_g1_i1:3-662(-)